MAKKQVDMTNAEFEAHSKARAIAVETFKIEAPSIEMVNSIRDALVDLDRNGLVDDEACEELLEDYFDAKDDVAKVAATVFGFGPGELVHELALEIFSRIPLGDDEDEKETAAAVEKLRSARAWAMSVYKDDSPRATLAAFDRAFED